MILRFTVYIFLTFSCINITAQYRIPFRIGNTWELAKPDGTIVSSLKMDSISVDPNDTEMYVAYKSGKMGLIDSSGKLIVPFSFDDIWNAEPKKFWLQKGDKIIFTSNPFSQYFEMEYDEAYGISGEDYQYLTGVMVIRKNGLYGLLDETDNAGYKIHTPIQYDSIVFDFIEEKTLCRGYKKGIAYKIDIQSFKTEILRNPQPLTYFDYEVRSYESEEIIHIPQKGYQWIYERTFYDPKNRDSMSTTTKSSHIFDSIREAKHSIPRCHMVKQAEGWQLWNLLSDDQLDDRSYEELNFLSSWHYSNSNKRNWFIAKENDSLFIITTNGYSAENILTKKWLNWQLVSSRERVMLVLYDDDHNTIFCLNDQSLVELTTKFDKILDTYNPILFQGDHQIVEVVDSRRRNYFVDLVSGTSYFKE